jgi:hypothetical protein
VTLSIWLVVFGYHHTKSEILKNELIHQEMMADSGRFSNPMAKMWKCIAVNILAQTIGLARTIYYVSDPTMDCRFTFLSFHTATTQRPKQPFSSSSWSATTTWVWWQLCFSSTKKGGAICTGTKYLYSYLEQYPEEQ